MTTITTTEYTAEAIRLSNLEAVIEQGQKAFVAVGSALREIRDDKLYRDTHSTFAGYVQQRFGFGKSHAYRLMETADETSPMGDKIDNERQAREVAKAPADQQEAVVERATEIADERCKDLTAAIVKEAREELADESDTYVTDDEENPFGTDDEYEDVPDDEPTEANRIGDAVDRIWSTFTPYECRAVADALIARVEASL